MQSLLHLVKIGHIQLDAFQVEINIKKCNCELHKTFQGSLCCDAIDENPYWGKLVLQLPLLAGLSCSWQCNFLK